MAVEIILPKLGMDMQSGTIMTWYKNEGDTVQKGEPLFELMTDKVNIEVEADDSGVLLKRYYETGVELPVFTAIGCIGQVGEQVPEGRKPIVGASSESQVSAEERAQLRSIRSKSGDGFSSGIKTLRATPSARRLASQNKIDLSKIEGSGPKGRIQVEDVEAVMNESKKVEKTEIPQKKVFDTEPKEIERTPAVNEVDDVILNPGMENSLDETLENLVCGMSDLEAELGSETKEETFSERFEATPIEKSEIVLKKTTASPLAEKIADVEKIDILSIGDGSGPDGRIMKEDVLQAMEKAAMHSKSKIEHVEVIPSPIKVKANTEVETVGEETVREETQKMVPLEETIEEIPEAKQTPEKQSVQPELDHAEVQITEKSHELNTEIETISQKRKIIADHMVKSNLETAVITLTTEIDMTEVKELRKKISKKVENETGCRCTYTDFLLVSVSKALMEHPYINGSIQEDEIIFHHYVNLGLAVGMEDGLIVPVIHGIDALSFSETVQKRTELLKAVKSKKLTGDYFQGSTFTVTNLGMYGILEFSAIINQPNSAILSVGEVVDRIRLFKGEPTPRSVMKVSINLDHRIADGMVGAKFLQAVKSYMENPALLLF
ncbi:MAG: 2-oxo acid dehydrogenase subunit E2 [Eubacterium sp.]